MVTLSCVLWLLALAFRRFFVNLLCGESESSDIALHFNPRFDGWDKVIFNTCQNGSWQSEEKIRSMPFSKGQSFEMVIMATSQGYQVGVHTHFFNPTYSVLLDLPIITWLPESSYLSWLQLLWINMKKSDFMCVESGLCANIYFLFRRIVLHVTAGETVVMTKIEEMCWIEHVSLGTHLYYGLLLL